MLLKRQPMFFLNYNLASLCAFRDDLIFLVVNTSPPPPFRTTSKLADCFSSALPRASASRNTRRETVGLSRLPR